jgi:CRP-like cAMP-binding protein
MMIREVDLFKGLPSEVMNQIADICVEESHPKDAVLFEKGEEANRMYILVDGQINLVISNGGTMTFNLTEPGTVFGWSALVDSGEYTTSGICASDSQVIRIERDDLDKIFNKYPNVGVTVLKRLGSVFAQRIRSSYLNYLSSG